MKFLSKIVFIFVCLASLILLSAFYLQNDQQVIVDLLFSQGVELSLGVALILALVVGVLLGMLAVVPTVLSLKARLLSARKRLQANS